MNKLFDAAASANTLLARGLDALQPLFLLGLRVYVANVFFKSGLTKIDDFSSTVALFENEYTVPLLSPTVAAAMGTGAELVLPILFALGIFSRPVAIAFFIFNAVAVISYPEISPAGVKDHVIWGAMIATVVFFGPGKLALDQFLSRFGLATVR